MRVAVLYSINTSNQSLSYQLGWPEAFEKFGSFKYELINIGTKRSIQSLIACEKLLGQKYDVIVLLHSVFSNALNLNWVLKQIISRTRAFKVFFIGNEYKLMPEKIEFCSFLGIQLMFSQSNNSKVFSIYQKALHCFVEHMPNTGVDLNLFKEERPFWKRPVDIGYRGYQSPLYLGHDERTQICKMFENSAITKQLSLDVSMEHADRVSGKKYVKFLNSCKSQIGTEAGGDFFDITDKTRIAVNDYITKNASANIDQIYGTFFEKYGQSVPMRIISGRNVEAGATKSIQILFEGDYGGYLKPDKHYIPLKKNCENLGEAIEKFHDIDFCKRLVANCFDIISAEFTYERLISKFETILRRRI